MSDDGHGMDARTITEKWMEPATPSKVDVRLSPGNRIMMGSKGIGRFAAAKLGRKMSLNSVVSIPDGNHEVLIPEIDWDDFGSDRYLSDIEIEFLEQKTEAQTGTLIEIRELREAWNKESITRLILELRRLLSPIQADSETGFDFRIILDLSDCKRDNAGFDGLELLQTAFGEMPSGDDGQSNPYEIKPYPLLTVSDYDLDGEFDSAGNFKGTYTNHRGGLAGVEVNLPAPKNSDSASPGPFGIKLRVFDREADAIKHNMARQGLGQLSAREARRILDEVAGVAIYRNGFRIRPYGDVESDWLTLDKRRVQDPSLRIGNNQVAGYVTIDDTRNANLVERSSREGLEENPAFRRLQELVVGVFSQILEPRRQQFRESVGISRKRSGSFDEARRFAELKRIRRKILPLLSQQERVEAEKVIDREMSDLSRQIDQLEERQRALEASSSLGAIVGEVLHEGGPPAAYLKETAGWFRAVIESTDAIKTSGKTADQVRKKLVLMEKQAGKLEVLFRSLRPLAGGKRGKPETFNPVPIIISAFEIFQMHDVRMRIMNPENIHLLIGYRDDLSTALVNLIGNSIHWLLEHDIDDPTIDVILARDEEGTRIVVKDNGPGIPEEFISSIFDVGFTLKPHGTGLGLNIARETLARSGAKLFFHPGYKDGAMFEIFYPGALH